MWLLTILHRWLGVVMGLFFAMWFFSGMVMMYVPFPSLPDGERLKHLAPIDTQEITVSPEAAIAACGSDRVNGLRMITFDARPTYVCAHADASVELVHADSGTPAVSLDESAVRAFARQHLAAPIAHVVEVEFDQWTVHQRFNSLRPLYRIELEDSLQTHLYLSSLTGEAIQRTTGQQRFWNYLGAVVHWVYPTILRKHWAAWDAVVWWLSLFGVVCAVLGLVLGLSHWIKLRRAGRVGLTPFRGWMKWHHVLSLFIGLFVVSWIVSGWLSMDHGRLFSTPNPTPDLALNVQGGEFAEVVASLNTQAFARYKSPRELTLSAFGGNALVVAKDETGVVDTPEISPQRIADVVARAASDGIADWRVVPDDDLYTSLREGSLPTGTVRVALADPNQTWIHIDRYSGHIISVMDSSRRLYRWLYNGLH
ncbi:MAG: PepSY domain-containing protein, partial [Pseudomonadota bacterium]